MRARQASAPPRQHHLRAVRQEHSPGAGWASDMRAKHKVRRRPCCRNSADCDIGPELCELCRRPVLGHDRRRIRCKVCPGQHQSRSSSSFCAQSNFSVGHRVALMRLRHQLELRAVSRSLLRTADAIVHTLPVASIKARVAFLSASRTQSAPLGIALSKRDCDVRPDLRQLRHRSLLRNYRRRIVHSLPDWKVSRTLRALQAAFSCAPPAPFVAVNGTSTSDQDCALCPAHTYSDVNKSPNALQRVPAKPGQLRCKQSALKEFVITHSETWRELLPCPARVNPVDRGAVRQRLLAFKKASGTTDLKRCSARACIARACGTSLRRSSSA